MLDDDQLDLCFETAVKLARESGKIVCDALCSKKDFETKKCAIDVVTEKDKEVEKFIFKGLKEKFPQHKFIGEETSTEAVTLTDEPTWIVDPIDGTMNFLHGLQYVAVSIALVINKQTEIAVVYSVTEKCLYTARRGKGAFREDEKLRVSNVDDISQALVLMEAQTAESLINVRNIFTQAHHIRSIGSAVIASCFVASGRAECFFHFSLQCWDVAAVSLIVTEAGGVVIDPNGSDFDMLSHRMLCASSANVALQISALMDIPHP